MTVIPVAASSSHVARRRRASGPPAFDAARGGARPVGVFLVRDGTLRWSPALDLNRLLLGAELAIGAVAVAHELARRPSGPRAAVHMGPGGWISMKGGSLALRPAPRAWFQQRRPSSPAPRRPLWAKLFSAKSLQSLLRY